MHHTRINARTGQVTHTPLTDEEITEVSAQALFALRRERTERLATSDWTQLADAPLDAELRAAWAAYRQALRDLPANTSDPMNVLWPTPPGGFVAETSPKKGRTA